MHTIPDADGAFHFPAAIPVQHMKTYRVAVPLSTHWRPASCMEYQCEPFLQGWVTVIDEATDLGKQQAYYIRHDRSRRHREEKGPDGLTRFHFEAGQTCYRYSEHRVRNMREERFLVLGGDWRGNPTGSYREHASAADWQEDFEANQASVSEAVRRG